MPATQTAPQDLANCLDGYAEAGHRLIHDFGFDIRYAALGPDLGDYDGDRRLVLVNSAAPLEDQLWFLLQVWQLCAIGPHAVPEATYEHRTLRLVES
jgi:hypothetical protein